MKPEIVIYTLLSNAAAVAALVGTRIYSDVRPESDPAPAIVLSLISDTPELPVSSTAGADRWTGRMQVTCLGATSESAKTVAEAAITACHKKNGTIGGIQTIVVLVDTRTGANYDMQVDTYQQSVDFIIYYYR
jgi:hypothetical protein